MRVAKCRSCPPEEATSMPPSNRIRTCPLRKTAWARVSLPTVDLTTILRFGRPFLLRFHRWMNTGKAHRQDIALANSNEGERKWHTSAPERSSQHSVSPVHSPNTLYLPLQGFGRGIGLSGNGGLLMSSRCWSSRILATRQMRLLRIERHVAETSSNSSENEAQQITSAGSCRLTGELPISPTPAYHASRHRRLR